jgi:hypothetical protein
MNWWLKFTTKLFFRHCKKYNITPVVMFYLNGEQYIETATAEIFIITKVKIH